MEPNINMATVEYAYVGERLVSLGIVLGVCMWRCFFSRKGKFC